MALSQIRVGIIGTGWGARVQVAVFRAAGMEIAALCGRDPEKTAAIAGRLRVPLSLTAWEALVAHPDLDLVIISSPPATHRDMAIAALEAGKHVLCEKPTALNATEAAAMAAAAAARPKQIAGIDFELRFHPSRQLIRRLVTDGYIGKLRHADVAIVQPSRADPSRPWDWWSSKAAGGGILGAVGSHMVDQLIWIFGPISEAAGWLETFTPQRRDDAGELHPVDSDDYAAFIVRFEVGGIGSVSLSAVGRNVERSYFALYGNAGTLVLDGGRLRGARAEGEELRDLTPADNMVVPASLFDSEWTRASVRIANAFATTIRAGEAKVSGAATFADGYRNQQVLDAVRRASEAAGWCAISQA